MTTTVATPAYPLQRERNLILALLLLLAAAAWAILVWQWAITDDGDMSLTMGMGAPVFLAIWVAMMVAMMFPTAAPMILMFARVQAGKRQREQPFVPTWLFVASYLIVWTAFGVLAYGAAIWGEELADRSQWVTDNAGRIGGGVLIAAGLYQLSPLKRACLSKCRTPMGFIMSSWRDGYAGAVRMGASHGVYCLGCCWLLFVILFPLGMMNVAAMAVITLLIFAEKSLPIARQATFIAAIALVGYGAVVIAEPDALPTMMAMDESHMDAGAMPADGMPADTMHDDAMPADAMPSDAMPGSMDDTEAPAMEMP
jgi:predicted metal-binding membrane protein